MERFEKKTEILTDLLHINKECSGSYRTYIGAERDRPEAAIVVQRLEGLCRDCIAELHMRIDPTYGDPADAVDLKGVIYRSWVQNDDMDFSRKTPGFFNNCEQKIKGIKRAYEQALKAGDDMSGDIRDILYRQLQKMGEAFDLINAYRSQKENTTYSSMA